MSDKANPLATYHQRQITDQAQPVVIYGGGGTGSNVAIGAGEFYAQGNVIYGNAADRPDASAATAALGGIPCFYYAMDTGALSRNTGAAWVS